MKPLSLFQKPALPELPLEVKKEGKKYKPRVTALLGELCRQIALKKEPK